MRRGPMKRGKPMTDPEYQFTEWLEQLQSVCTRHGWPEDYVSQCGSEAWREMFEDGLTPKEAFYEEATCD